jgi:RNA polymerase sigma factor (sigma-70 family)
MQENELIQYVIAAEAKDNNAMEILYTEFYQDVVFICRNFKLSEEDCKDIAQDTFIKAFSSLSSLQDKGKFKQWLLRIANNKCLDLLRHNSVLTIDSMHSDEEVLELPDKSKTTDEIVIEKETEKTLMTIIERLPIEQRVTVFLYFYQDYSVKEIAGLYNCTESTVRSRLNYAKKFMHKEIEKLESKETKHHCLVLLPFLYAIFANQREAFACEIPNALNVISNVMVGGTVGNVAAGNAVVGATSVATGNVAGATTGNVMATTVSSVGKAAAVKMSLGKIVAIGALAITLIGGGIGAAVYFTSGTEEETSASKEDNNKDNGDKGDNEDKDNGSAVDKAVAELIAKGKEALNNVEVFDIHSTFGSLYGLDEMYIDAKNMVFEYIDGRGNAPWYIEKEAEGKVYMYEEKEDNIGENTYMSKRELSAEEIENFTYVKAMSTLFDGMNNDKARVEKDSDGSTMLVCPADMSILETISKYYRFKMEATFYAGGEEVVMDMTKCKGDLKLYMDEENRIERIEMDSKELEDEFWNSLTEEQKEYIVVKFKFAIDFDYEHKDHIAPFVSGEIKQLAVPYTITIPYKDAPTRYMLNFDCGWDAGTTVYESSISGIKDGMQVAIFHMKEVSFEDKNPIYTEKKIEEAIRGNGGTSPVFTEIWSNDIGEFEWTNTDGMLVGICHTESDGLGLYETIAAIRLNFGDEKRIVCISVVDEEAVKYEDDISKDARKAVALDLISSLKCIELVYPGVDRENIEQ